MARGGHAVGVAPTHPHSLFLERMAPGAILPHQTHSRARARGLSRICVRVSHGAPTPTGGTACSAAKLGMATRNAGERPAWNLRCILGGGQGDPGASVWRGKMGPRRPEERSPPRSQRTRPPSEPLSARVPARIPPQLRAGHGPDLQIRRPTRGEPPTPQ